MAGSNGLFAREDRITAKERRQQTEIQALRTFVARFISEVESCEEDENGFITVHRSRVDRALALLDSYR